MECNIIKHDDVNIKAGTDNKFMLFHASAKGTVKRLIIQCDSPEHALAIVKDWDTVVNSIRDPEIPKKEFEDKLNLLFDIRNTYKNAVNSNSLKREHTLRPSR